MEVLYGLSEKTKAEASLGLIYARTSAILQTSAAVMNIYTLLLHGGAQDDCQNPGVPQQGW